MKRWRTDGFARRSSLAAAVALLIAAIIAGRPSAGCAEQPSPVPASFSQERLQRVGDYIRNEIATGKIPGAILLIQQHAQPVYFENFGVRDVATKLPMTADTIFRIYSMSKPITSVAAMMLVEDGKLSLDDPVSKYIPAFAGVKVGVDKRDQDGKPALVLEPLNRPITVEDLLRHTSGLTYGFYGDSAVRKLYVNSDLFKDDFDNAEFAERLAQLPLAEQPGTLWDYGHSTDVLGRVMEVVSGKSLLQIEKELLLDPLGMTDTGFYVTDHNKFDQIARPMPNDSNFRVGFESDPETVMRWESGGGGMVSTLADFTPFLQMLLNGGTLNGKTYLGARSFAQMTSDHIGPGSGVARDYYYFPGDGFGFSLGFGVRTDPGNAKPPP